MLDVVVVSYGDRWSFLEAVLQSLAKVAYINKLILVNNNVSYALREKIRNVNDLNIHIIELNTNSGSASGFSKGLQYVMDNSESNYILLLDDDNLLSQHALLNINKVVMQNNPAAYACLRIKRDYLVKAGAGYPINLLFPVKNSFFGFDFIVFLKKLFYKRLDSKLPENSKNEIIIPMAPYGGLLFHKSLVDIVGLPDERMFLYADDFEFTYRLTLAGIKIKLLQNCEIDDLENAWVGKKESSALVRLLNLNNYKAFFTARNTAYFSYHKLKTNNAIYFLNKFLVIMHAAIYAVLHSKWKNFKYLYLLIKDGEKAIFNNEAIMAKQKK